MFLAWPKRCIHCGETKMTSEFHLNRTEPDGMHPYCKSCVRPMMAAYYRRGAVLKVVAPGRRCTHCGEFKSLDQFHAHKRTALGVQTYCKPCGSKRKRELQRRKREQNQQQGAWLRA